ncbi:MAG TPA: GAF domain-containing sensor histidine kinase [Phototrophicaceae bacterium]|nr:GAF domain-containing sensor histidine kinase [Phototrophicaceae bacterium]
MGKNNLSAVLPLTTLDRLVPAFQALVSQGQTIIIVDAENHIYYGDPQLVLPHCATATIYADRETVGEVRVYADHPDAPLTPAADFLALTLSQLALEVQRRQQLSDEVLARYDELNLIYRLETSFVQGVSKDELLKTILAETNRIIRADAGVVYSWDALNSSLVPVNSLSDQFNTDFWEGRVHELALSTLYAYEDAQLFDGEKLLCVPLRYNEKLLGALVLLYEAEDKTFKANDVNLLTTLAQNTSLFLYAVDRNNELVTALEDLQRARELLSRAERFNIIGQTVAGLFHDMKKPLSNAMGYAGLLQESDLSFEERHLFAGQIIKFIQTFSDMAQEILDYVSGDSKVTKTPMPVKTMMEQVGGMLIPPGLENPVEIILNYDTVSDEIINVDLRFIRVFQNLVNNAIDAIELNGGSKVEISAENDGDKVRFSVTDDGPGIPEHIVATIFEPFFTHGKAGGTGLGLAIVNRMISIHGGEIHYEPAPGKGARFVFTVPVSPNGSSN